MKIPKPYFRDRLLLLLLTCNVFLTFVILLFLTFRLSSGHSSYIVQYRQTLGADAFKAGSLSQLLSFALFAAVILVVNLLLSMRVYRIHRQMSAIVLGMGTLLLVICLVVSNALLVLR